MDSCLPVFQPCLEAVHIVRSSCLVDRMRLSRVHQMNKIDRDRRALATEIPETTRDQCVQSAGVLSGRIPSMNAVCYPFQLAGRIRAINVIRELRLIRTLVFEAPVVPVLGQRQDPLDFHHVNNLVVCLTSKADDPVTLLRHAPDAWLTDGERAPCPEQPNRAPGYLLVLWPPRALCPRSHGDL
jgi:hypothetical protein